MSEPSKEEKQEEPLDPAVERIQVKLRRLLMGSTLIMFLGFGAVVAAIVYKINENSAEDSTTELPTVVTEESLRKLNYRVPEGSRITATALTTEHLSVTYETPNGENVVLLIDIETWQVFSRFELLPTQ